MSGQARSADPVLRFGRRSVPWLLVGLLLGLGVGVLLVARTTPLANASTVVELSAVEPQVDLNSSAPVKAVTVDTDAQLLTSDEVVQAAGAAAGRSPARARASLGVSAAQITRVITLTYTDPSPKRAQAGAEAAATALLRARERLVVVPLREQLRLLGQSLAAVDAVDPVDPAAAPPAPSGDLVSPSGRQQAAVSAELALTGAGTVLQHALALPATDRGSIAVPLATSAGVGALVLFLVGLLRDRRARAAVDPAAASAREATVRPFRRLRAVVVTLVLGAVGVGAGLGVAAQVDDRPLGVASVVLRPLPGNAFSGRGRDESVALGTEAQLVSADDVLAKAVAGGRGTVLGLRDRVQADVLPSSEVLTVSVRGSTTEGPRTATTVAGALLEVRQARAVAAYGRQRDTLTARIAETRAALTRAQGPGGDPTLAPSLSQRVVTLTEDLRSLPTDVTPGSVIDTTSSPQVAKELLRRGLPVLLGGLGLLAGGLLARRGRRAARRRPDVAVRRPEPSLA